MPTLMAMILVIALWAGCALGATCNTPAPMALPITDTVVDPKVPGSLMRGIPAKIGTPPQDIVVLPWPDLNNTYIYDTEAYCDPTIIYSDTICEVRRGGLFKDGQSSTFSKSSDLVAAGGAGHELANVRGAELGVAKLLSTSLGGTDRLTIAPGNETTMPIGIPRMNWDHGYTILHALGLGSNSTYINSLLQAKQIPSRVWSIFWGRMWTGSKSTDMDGSVVLGGYDQEKVIGQNVTQRLDYSEDTGCWTGMRVTVSNLLLNFRNGSDHSVMPRDSAVSCCIVPQRQLVWEGPVDVVSDFVAATGMNDTGLSFGLHWGANQFKASDPRLFDGDATFVLSSGLSIRVPNSQLMPPAVSFDSNGTRTIDKSKRELLFSGVSDNPTTLGRYFFTAAYLMVDHDAGTFTMWQANPSTKTNLVPVVSKTGDDKDCQEGGSGSGGSTGSGNGGGSAGEGGNNGNTGGATSSSSSSVSAGPIAGGVVGGVVALAAVAALIFFFMRRKKRMDAAALLPEMDAGQHTVGFPMTPSTGHMGGADGVYYYKPGENHAGIQEAPGREHLPQELQATPTYGHGSAVWSSTGGSPVSYELDSGETQRDSGFQGHPQHHSSGYVPPYQPYRPS